MNDLVSIADIAQINPPVTVKLPNNAECSFIPMEVVNGVAGDISKLLTRPFKELSKGYRVFSENDVLVAKITPCMENGKCAIARGLKNGIGFGSTEFHMLRASNKVRPEWLYFFWRLPQTRALAERSMTGTAGQRRVPGSFFQGLKVPVPSLTAQDHCIAQLKEA